MNIKYLIFDCDGVLVDSEVISASVEAKMKTRFGHPISTDEQIRRFTGMGSKSQPVIDEMRKYPEGFYTEVQSEIMKVMESELKAVEGIKGVLEGSKLPRCVASSSKPHRIELSLRLTGLSGYFGEHVYSATMVERGKPEPDLFLYAAQRLSAPTQECLVIEDSIAGVQAAKAAGMKVFGFTGGSHAYTELAGKLQMAGADLIFSNMAELLTLIDHEGSRSAN